MLTWLPVNNGSPMWEGTPYTFAMWSFDYWISVLKDLGEPLYMVTHETASTKLS